MFTKADILFKYEGNYQNYLPWNKQLTGFYDKCKILFIDIYVLKMCHLILYKRNIGFQNHPQQIFTEYGDIVGFRDQNNLKKRRFHNLQLENWLRLFSGHWRYLTNIAHLTRNYKQRWNVWKRTHKVKGRFSLQKCNFIELKHPSYKPNFVTPNYSGIYNYKNI